MADPSSTVSGALIGEIFVERGHITPAQLEEALATQAETGELLGEILVSRYGIPRVELAGVLAEQWATMERAGDVAPNEPIAAAAAAYADTATPATIDVTSDVDFERRPIGEIFVEQGVVTQSQLEAALTTQAESGQRLGEVLVAQGIITRLELASALADQWSTLQKIRPPEPKPAEAWQELVVRATPPTDSASGQAPNRETSAEVEGLRDAVTALEERLRLVSATSAPAVGPAPDEALRELGGTFERQLEELAQRLDETLATEIAAVREALDELREKVAEPVDDTRIAALEQRLETAVDGLLARIETTTPDQGSAEAVDALQATIAGLEHRTAEAPTRDELDALRVAFAAVSEEVKTLTETPSGITHDELEQRLARVADDLGARIDSLTGNDGDETALAELRARLTELAAEVAELPRSAEPSDMPDRVASLIARLDETDRRLPELDELRTRLEALGDAPARIDATIDELDSRLSGALAQLPTADRITALEESLAALPTSDRIVALEESLTELPELRARLDAIGAAPDAASPDELAALSARLDELGASLETFASSETVAELTRSLETVRSAEDSQIEFLRVSVRELSEGVRELSARPIGVPAEELENAIASLRSRVGELGEAQSALARRNRDEVSRARIDELVGQERAAREELASRLGELAEASHTQLDERLGREQAAREELASRLAELAEAQSALAGRSPDEVSRTELEELLGREQAAREELSSRLAELQQGVDEIASVAGSDEVARQGVAEVRAQLEGIGTRIGEAAGHELGELKERVAALAASLADDRLAGELAELRARLEPLATTVDALAAETSRDTTPMQIADLRGQIEQLVTRVSESELPDVDLQPLADRVESLATDYGARLHQLEETRRRVDDLDRRVTELPPPVPDLSGELTSLRNRLDELAARTHDDEVARQGIAELETRLARLAEEPVHDQTARGEVSELATRVQNLEAAGSAKKAVARLDDELDEHRTLVEGRFGEVWGKVVELDELRERIDRLDGASAEAVGRGEIDALQTRFGELASRYESLAPSDWVAGIERTAAESVAALLERLEALEQGASREVASAHEVAQARIELEALGHQLAQLSQGLEETRGSVDAIDGNIATTLQALVKDMVSAATVAELAEQVHGRLAAIEAAAAPTRAALDELGLRLGAAEQSAWALPEELDGRFARLHQELSARIEALSNDQTATLASVQERLDEIAGADEKRLVSLEHTTGYVSARLDGVEARLTGVDGTVAERVDRLEERVDAAAKHAKEQGKQTDKAIRKGLAALAERLTANEDAYVESGKALRRAIERLGAAVIEADTRIAEMPLDAPEDGYVAFVPTGDGYRLRPLEGKAPAVGDTIDLGEELGQLRVSRIATSPLPLDRRACAYLERV